MALVVLRFVFVMVAVGLGFQLIHSPLLTHGAVLSALAGLRRLILALALAVIVADMSMRRKQLDTCLGRLFGPARRPVSDLRAAAGLQLDPAAEFRRRASGPCSCWA